MYRAPVSEISFTLNHTAGLRKALEDQIFGDLSEDLVDAILSEAGKFASEEIAPLNTVGDTHGTVLKDAKVTMPPGWTETYRRWCEAGWNALTGPSDFGGQDLPTMLSMATQEMWNSASMAFGVGPTLTIGAIEAVSKHASDELKDVYLEKLVTGEWTGTMNLTEPHAGSDLGTLKTRAEPIGDGRYRIFGQKIYITYGEHDLTDNIVHMVLARLPDAPPGTRGISLFLVPKFLPDLEGRPGERNDVQCAGVEHKLGLHGSPTCIMIYGDGYAGTEPGAIGWLVGEENRGLACMFTMMNNARLAVGIQGVSVAERALQQATAYAGERRQGRAPGWEGEGMSPIIEHPDVRRMLLTMRALTSASRSICYACAHAIDMARASDGETKQFWQERADLLTPIAKAFSTDCGSEVASLGVQVHGGMGYIEETGAAQHLRDARITQIYEGTNGIQAIDLVNRKLALSGGQHVLDYIEEMRAIAEETRQSNRPGFGQMGEKLVRSLDDLHAATVHIQGLIAEGETEKVLAGATPYGRLFGVAAGGAYLARAALASNGADPDAAMRVLTARFFAESICPETVGLRTVITEGAGAVLEAETELLAS